MLTLTALRITSSCTVKVYLGLICLYSGIFTFSVALPQKPTVAIDELSQDVTFIEDIGDKYHRPNNILHLLVPTVNASIYIERCHIFKKMLQKTQGNLCGVFMQLHCCRKNYISWKKITQKMTYYRTCTEFERMHCFYHHIPPSCNQLPGAIIWSTYFEDLWKKTQKITDDFMVLTFQKHLELRL